MILFDSFSSEPRDELRAAWQRVPLGEYAQGYSLKGRLICVWKACYHTIAVVMKPTAYIALAFFAAKVWEQKHHHEQQSLFYWRMSVNLILTGLVTPLGQVVQAVKAVAGIIYPRCYFRENEFNVYFKQLAVIAKEVKCEQSLVDLFENGGTIILESLQGSMMRHYFEAERKRDLTIICERLKNPELPADDKMAVLKMFAPLPSDLESSGLYACNDL